MTDLISELKAVQDEYKNKDTVTIAKIQDLTYRVLNELEVISQIKVVTTIEDYDDRDYYFEKNIRYGFSTEYLNSHNAYCRSSVELQFLSLESILKLVNKRGNEFVSASDLELIKQYNETLYVLIRDLDVSEENTLNLTIKK